MQGIISPLMKTRRAASALVVFLLLATGCVSKSVYLKETQRADQLKAQSDSQAAQIQSLQANLDASKTNNADLMKTLEAKKAEIAKLKGSYDQLVSGLKSELDAGQVTITQLKGRLSVNMVDKILFNSGQAEIKPEGHHVLDRVGEVLKKLQDK